MNARLFMIPVLILFQFAAIYIPASASQAGKEYNDADAQLNSSYQRFISRLSDLKEKTLALQAQRSWIKYRDDNVAFFATHYPESKGGLFYGIHLTRERTAYLDSLLKAPPETNPEGSGPDGYE
jgi:uncharacterized protein YecT (DUF1311 family)